MDEFNPRPTLIPGVLAPFDVASMRGHLEGCLQQRELTPFPRITARRTRGQKVAKVAVDGQGVDVLL